MARTAKTRRFRRPVVHLVGYLSLLLGALVSVEFICRVLGPLFGDEHYETTLSQHTALARGDASAFRFVADPILPYRLRPGFELHAERGRYVTRHNSLGFRDDFTGGPKEVGSLRIACLGGSTTYGTGVKDNRHTYPELLEGYLEKINSDGKVEVINMGVGGYTSLDVQKTLEHHGLPLGLDLALVQVAINDVGPRLYPDFSCSYEHFRKRMDTLGAGYISKASYRSHAFLLAGYALGWIKPLTLQSQTHKPLPPVEEALRQLDINGPHCYEAHLTGTVKLGTGAGVRVVLLTEAYMDSPDFVASHEASRLLEEGYKRGLAEHNEIVRKTAISTGAILIDLDRAMPRRREYFADAIHMTERGNQVKAELVRDALVEQLPEIFSSD